MTCHDIDHLSVLVLFDEAGPDERLRHEGHLAGCPGCREVHDERARVVEIGSACSGPVDPPAAVVAAVVARARPAGPHGRFLVMAVAAGLVAAGLLGLVSTVPTTASPSPPPAAAGPVAGRAEPESPGPATPEFVDRAVDRRVATLAHQVTELTSDRPPLLPSDPAVFEIRTARLSGRIERLKARTNSQDF